MEIQVGDRSQNKNSYNLRSPFSQEILNEPNSNRIKMPTIDSFDGFTNLIDHIEGYRALMALQGASDVLQCITFPAILKKIARV